MPNLIGYKEVARIEISGKNYYFAIYDDGQQYSVGDTVAVSGKAKSEFRTIEEILTPESAKERYGSNITAEIICKVDDSAFKKREANRKRKATLKNQINKAVWGISSEVKLELYAEKFPKIKAMLDEYRSLGGTGL